MVANAGLAGIRGAAEAIARATTSVGDILQIIGSLGRIADLTSVIGRAVALSEAKAIGKAETGDEIMCAGTRIAARVGAAQAVVVTE